MLSSRYIADGQATIPLNAGQIAARNGIIQKLKSGQYLVEPHPCLICSKDNFETLAEKDRYGLPVTVVVCRDCGLVQTNPRLSEDSCRGFYDAEYRPLYVGDGKPTQEFFNRQIRQGQKILHRIERVAGPILSGQIVVEIGCGAGGILEAFRARGCQVIGFDWGTDYLEFGRRERGLDLRVGGLNMLSPTLQPHVVIYSHVLEHVPDPRAELRQLRALIRAETLVYIEVPGVKKIHQAYDGDFLCYLQNAHVSHFSQQTLKNLLRLERFEPFYCDESVECICRLTPELPLAQTNDFESLVQYLRTTESRRLRIRRNPVRLLRKYCIGLLTRLGWKEAVRRIIGR